MEVKTTTNKNFNGEFSVIIKHKTSDGYELIEPVVEDGVKWETDRQGSAGKLTFKLYKDKNDGAEFQEGDSVALRYRNEGGEWTAIFTGYIFKKTRNKQGWIDVTAYDQLRYFKNKATYVYTNKTAGEVVKMIADDYKLPIGTIEQSSYKIGERVEDNQSLFDIVQNALDQTLISTTDLYVLYADPSGLCLRNAHNMKLDLVINESTAENFDYTSSIDDETYNEIELYYDNDETNKREYYRAYDQTNGNNWGRLRLTESIQNPTNAADRVKKMLKVYNQKTRELKVTGAFGDCRCRAGASVIVQLELGDVTVNNYMLIEKATHTFKKDEYRMDLTLDGFKTNDNGLSEIIYSESNVVKSDKTSDKPTTEGTPDSQSQSSYEVTVSVFGLDKSKGHSAYVWYTNADGKSATKDFYGKETTVKVTAKTGTSLGVVLSYRNLDVEIHHIDDSWVKHSSSSTHTTYKISKVNKNATLSVKLVDPNE